MRAALLVVFVLVGAPFFGQTYLGKADDAWLKQFRDGDGKERRSAAFALGKIGVSRREVLQAPPFWEEDPRPVEPVPVESWETREDSPDS